MINMLEDEVIAIYTSDDSGSKAEELRRFLMRSGFPYEVRNCSQNPEFVSELIQKFGETKTLPGICIGSLWIPGDSEDLYESLGRYFVDQMLLDTETAASKLPSNAPTAQFHPEITMEADVASINDRFGAKPSAVSRAISGAASTSGGTMISSASTGNTVFAPVRLPNGTEVTVGALTRLLMQATNHHCVPDEGNPYFYFRGHEALSLWSLLFFENHKEEDVINFGRVLIQRGVVHNYTPNCDDFKNAFLVLQPLQEPRVLNSFVKWPSNDISCEEDPMDVILRLCRQMDELCADPNYKQNVKQFQRFEEASCQLQEIDMPTDPVERVTFALNLFNLMVRHAMIAAESRKWTWPTSLEQLIPFFRKIGYTVAGDWMSIADLLDCLYGRTGEALPELVTVRRKWWSCTSNTQPDENNQYYASKMIHTDPRILMATTWGTKNSPNVTTIYPNHLEEGLQSAAELFCQSRVVVGFDQVTLPLILSWYREDFGGSIEQVLYNILPYLSVSQLRKIQDLREAGRLNITFSAKFNWEVGLPDDDKPVVDDMEQARDNNNNKKKAKPRWGNSKNGPSNNFAQHVGENGVFKMPDITDPDEYEEDYEFDGQSTFQSDFSEITYGSEFEDLLGTRSQRRLGV